MKSPVLYLALTGSSPLAKSASLCSLPDFLFTSLLSRISIDIHQSEKCHFRIARVQLLPGSLGLFISTVLSVLFRFSNLQCNLIVFRGILKLASVSLVLLELYDISYAN